MDSTNNENMTEQEYLEMSNQFKEIMDEKDSKLQLALRNELDLKKVIMTSYGMLRVLDHMTDDVEIMLEHRLESCKDMIENFRGYLSDMLDQFIFD